MAVLLLILGILVAASGVVAIGFGIPLNEFTLGTTLMSGGATALTGGLILIGISAVVSELARLADGLGQVPKRASQRPGELVEPPLPASPLAPPVAVPGPRPPASSAPTAPAPARAREVLAREARPAASYQPSPSSVDVSAAAIERLRSTIPRTDSRAEPAPAGHAEETSLSPNGATPPYAPPPRTAAQPDAPEPQVAPEERGSGAVEALKASRLDFLFRSKPARPTLERESFETIWPTDARGSKSPAPPSAPERTASPVEANVAPPVQEPPPAPAVPEAPPTATIVKSGVVDGMAYTLYADGSIEAKLPQGTIRFGSVAELRAHIESNT